MSTNPALRMAGELSAQFQHLAEEEAAQRIAAHARLFWEPRIRSQLRAGVEAAGPSCDPVVRRVSDLLDDA